ncbi:MAG: hypothetical protein ACYDEA_03690 [Candidatus Dormibacteria bacterium]
MKPDYRGTVQPNAERLVSRRLPRDPRLSALVLAGYGVAAAALFWQTWVSPGNRLVGVGGDVIQQLWVIASVTHALFHGTSPFYTQLLNFPRGVNLMWDGIPFPLVPAFALADAVTGPVPAYDFMMTLVLALNAWCGYLACGHWVGHRRAAVLGGFLFGFGPAVVSQALDHPFLAAVFLLPLALLCLDQLVVQQSSAPWRWGTVLGLVAAGQFYTSEEVWATMAVVSAGGLLWLGCYQGRSVRAHWRHLVVGLGWAFAVMVPLIAGPLLFQFLGPGAVHGAPLSPSHFSGDLVGFVVPTWVTAIEVPALLSLSYLADPITADFSFYVGLPILALLVMLLLRDRGARVVAFFLGWTLTVAVLLMGPQLRLLIGSTGILMPEVLLEHVPFLGDFLPVRLDLYLDLGVAILVAIFADRSLRRHADTAARLLVTLAVASWLPTVAYPAISVSTPSFFTGSHFPSHGSLLVVPFARNATSDTAMLWQVESGFRFSTPDGYFTRAGSNIPNFHGPAPTPFSNDIWLVQWGGAPPKVTAHVRAEARLYLTQHQVAVTVLGPMQRQSVMRRWLSSVFGRPPIEEGGVDLWYG